MTPKTGNHFEKRLRILHDVGNALSRSDSVEELCRGVVVRGRKQLGFDRLSIWFIDHDDHDYMVGSFGVDEKGRLRNEFRERVRIDIDPIMRRIRADRAHSVIRTNTQLQGRCGDIVGSGTHIVAAIWTGEKIVGYLSTDNLLRKKPLGEHDRELLELYAATFGHLYTLKLTEDALRHAYNELRAVQDQLIRAAKMETVGELASGVAHEVKNPLAILLQGVEFLEKKCVKGDVKSLTTLKYMKEAVGRADNTVRDLLDFAHQSKPDFKEQSLNRIITTSLALVHHELAKHHIEVKKELGKSLPDVRVDRNKMEQVFVNLLLNSIYHMPSGGKITIRTYVETVDKTSAVFVRMDDTGTGIPKEILGRVFDPFFTTRRASGGTGLGLSIVKKIVDMHDAFVQIRNRQRGTGVEVMLAFKVRGER